MTLNVVDLHKHYYILHIGYRIQSALDIVLVY